MVYPTSEAGLRSWLESGLQAHQNGDIERALDAYRHVLASAPDHPAALRLLGTGLLQLGAAEEAVTYLERAARRQAKDPQLLANLAQAYIAVKRYADAGASFRKASRLAPNEVQFHVGIAAAAAMEGKLTEAESLLTRHAARFPRVPLVWFNLGNVLRDTQQPERAIEAYRKALALDPQMAEARNSLGSVLHSLLRLDEAEKEYRACIRTAPDFLLPRYNLASVTMDRGRFDDAEAASRDIVALAPDLADAHRLLGTALGFKGRLLDALACYRRAAAIAPDDAQTVQAYGAALMEAGYATVGLRWLAHAAKLAPDPVPLKQLTAGLMLAHGSLADGWNDYAQRPAAIELTEKYRALGLAETLPDTLEGVRVCVLAEQGLGDQLFFLRWAPQLAARGARVSYGPSGKLHGVLQRAPALTNVFSDPDAMPQADLHVLAGDLPRFLYAPASSALSGASMQPGAASAVPDFDRRTGVFWPKPPPTLSIPALPDRLAEMRERLEAFGPPPYIGLTWHGGTPPERQQSATWLLFKSIGIESLCRVMRNVRASFVALQRKPAPGDLDFLSTAIGQPVLDLTDLNNDLEGMLAVLTLLDDYVGVSNTNMHLRAAAARTARVLVPVPAEWRWLQSGDASPWFPGFAIYRQSLQGDWRPALERLASDLQTAHAQR